MSRNTSSSPRRAGDLAAAAGAWFAARLGAPEPPEHARSCPRPGRCPTCPASTTPGAAFGRADLEGRWTLAFFGFTYCPDICPATLQVLAGARACWTTCRRRTARSVVMISVDPGPRYAGAPRGVRAVLSPEFRGSGAGSTCRS
jgi:protein SCO1